MPSSNNVFICNYFRPSYPFALVDSTQYLTLHPSDSLISQLRSRLQVHKLCLASPTPLRLNSYEDGWHDLHAEPAPTLSLLLVSKVVHKEALPVLYVKNKLNFLCTLYEPELPFQYMSLAACSLIIDLAIHVQLARHSHTSYKHISCREIFQHCLPVKRFFVGLEASPNLPIAAMRA
jgi:hypothetical protein